MQMNYFCKEFFSVRDLLLEPEVEPIIIQNSRSRKFDVVELSDRQSL